jgi:hypothetical protein
MGKGIDMARERAPEHAELLDDLKEQLLIVFLKRLGGSIDIPVKEVDDTGGDLFAFSVDPATKEFHFEVRRKS